MTVMIDSHCHAWRRWPYDLGVPDADSRGSLEALLYEMDTHGIDHATVVCARIGGGQGGDGHPNPDNNTYVSDFAESHPDRITPWVDVDCAWRPEYHTPRAAQRLKGELERTHARGFTHYFRSQNDGWLRTDEGRQFFRTAADLGVVASLAVGAPWYEDLASIATENPTLPILLHHLTSPRRQQWEADIDAAIRIAGQPTVGVKVSGFNYNSEPFWDFPYPQARELFHRLYDAFGPHRLYWGSDFPASRDMLTYTQSIEVVRTHCDFLTSDELDGVLGNNLQQVLARASQPSHKIN